jgi:hypothetical protein
MIAWRMQEQAFGGTSDWVELAVAGRLQQRLLGAV